MLLVYSEPLAGLMAGHRPLARPLAGTEALPMEPDTVCGLTCYTQSKYLSMKSVAATSR